MSPPTKETRLLIRSIYDLLVEENKADRLRGFERVQELVFGRIEEVEKRQAEMERFLGIRFIKDQHYEKIRFQKKSN